MPRYGFAIASLLLVITYLPLFYIESRAQAGYDEIYSRALAIARLLRDMGSRGIDVSRLSENLSGVFALLDTCGSSDLECLVKASSTLDSIEAEAGRLREASGFQITISRLSLAIRIAILSSIPIIFYIYFPRLYSWWWFRSRRNWVVRSYRHGRG